MDLNEQQRRAVLHRGSGLLVLAGAGSGKTRVITARVRSVVDEGVPAKNILAVTFTNKAAKEMRERLHALGVPDDIWVGTFHSIGSRVLRMHHRSAGVSQNFTIYDSDAQKNLVKAILADTRGGDRQREGYVLHVLGQLKGQGVLPHEVGDHHLEDVPAPAKRIVREVYARYETALSRSDAVDFSDLLLKTVLLLRRANADEQHPARHLVTRFQHVLVDEFQDTNKIQMEMADLFATRGELCVVGDDDQAIYEWRGAYPDGMQEFSRRPGVLTVKLEDCYRCTAPVLRCANQLISRNQHRLGKTLRPHKDGPLVTVHRHHDERAEARRVALEISAPYDRHAVLYRTHAQSRPIEEAFRRASIPYTVVGGLRFYDRAEIKDVLSFYRLALNPNSDADLLRVANKPARGMGPKRMGQLKTTANQARASMFQALQGLARDGKDKPASRLHELLVKLHNSAQSSLSLLEFHDDVMRLTGLRRHHEDLANDPKATVKIRERHQRAVENIDELASDVSQFQRPGSTVERYVEHVSLVSSHDEEHGPSVPLMTMHASKGLEFEHVHIVGMEEGILPHKNSLAAERDGNPDAASEERRLAYVAVTRSQTSLTIHHCQFRSDAGRTSSRTPSRFLDDLPDDAVSRR